MKRDRSDPHNLEAERAVLGAVMVNNALLADAARVLTPADFYRDGHARVFRQELQLAATGAAVDILTVMDALARSGDLERVGAAYVAALVDGVPRSTNVETYATVVKQCARARSVIAQARGAIELFTQDPAAVGNGAGSRFAEAVRHEVEAAHVVDGAELVDEVALVRQPEPEYLVDGRLVAGTLGAIVGPPGIGKSFLGVDLALCVTTGQPWIGARTCQSGTVVYVAGEGARSIGRRVRVWKHAHDIDLTQPTGFYLYSGGLNLLDAQAVTRFIAATRRLCPVLVEVDTLARSMVGADENSSRDMGLAIAAADRIRTELGALVLFVHHTSKSGGQERGSSALRGALDTLLALNQVDDLLTLSVEKQKDAAPFSSIALRLEMVEDSCLVRLAHQAAAPASLSPTQLRCLSALQDSFSRTGGATTTEWKAAVPDVIERSFYRALKVLSDAGFVRKAGQRHVWTGKLVSESLTLTDSPTDTGTDTRADSRITAKFAS